MIEKIHNEALKAARDFKTAEIVLLEKVEIVGQHKVYLHYKCKNLYQYCTQVLKLSENVSYNLIAVCRKIKEVPALKESIRSGKLTVATARKIVPVLTDENQTEWISKATDLSQKQLERELAKRFPHKMRKERLEAVGDGIYNLDLDLDISEETRDLLERARDIESQRTKKACTIEETLSEVLKFYVDNNDPVKKAERAVKKREMKRIKAEGKSESDAKVDARRGAGVGADAGSDVDPSGKARAETENRTQTEAKLNSVSPISSVSASQFVMLRDQGQCTAKMPNGARCPDKRWLHEHHIIPRSEGGPDTPGNLTLLCEGHHRLHHFTEGHHWMHHFDLRSIEPYDPN